MYNAFIMHLGIRQKKHFKCVLNAHFKCTLNANQCYLNVRSKCILNASRIRKGFYLISEPYDLQHLF